MMKYYMFYFYTCTTSCCLPDKNNFWQVFTTYYNCSIYRRMRGGGCRVKLRESNVLNAIRAQRRVVIDPQFITCHFTPCCCDATQPVICVDLYSFLHYTVVTFEISKIM